MPSSRVSCCRRRHKQDLLARRPRLHSRGDAASAAPEKPRPWLANNPPPPHRLAYSHTNPRAIWPTPDVSLPSGVLSEDPERTSCLETSVCVRESAADFGFYQRGPRRRGGPVPHVRQNTVSQTRSCLSRATSGGQAAQTCGSRLSVVLISLA